MNIVVDLTSLLPGSENGGAKIMSTLLIKRLAALAPEHRFILLATPRNETELQTLTRENIQVVTLSPYTFSFHNLINWIIYGLFFPLIQCSRLIFPYAITARIQRCSQILRQFVITRFIIRSTKPDLFFYPFTAVHFKTRRIPAVSVIYDIQYHYYPFFFTPFERYERQKSFQSACKYANKLICISQFVKNTILESSTVSENQVIPIYIQLGQRLTPVSNNTSSNLFNQLNIKENEYLLFPANFWLHKNHQLLFTAFNYYRALYPQSKLKLVCTGDDNSVKNELKNAITQMGLSDWIILPGFLSDEEFACLLSGSKALIFPSLYEGFGMPVIEAMVHQKPVLCSNITSLPEIVGDAAILFDPRLPSDIVKAITCLENDPEMVNQLIAKGTQRAQQFCDQTMMAKQYLATFDTVMESFHY